MHPWIHLPYLNTNTYSPPKQKSMNPQQPYTHSKEPYTHFKKTYTPAKRAQHRNLGRWICPTHICWSHTWTHKNISDSKGPSAHSKKNPYSQKRALRRNFGPWLSYTHVLEPCTNSQEHFRLPRARCTLQKKTHIHKKEPYAEISAHECPIHTYWSYTWTHKSTSDYIAHSQKNPFLQKKSPAQKSWPMIAPYTHLLEPYMNPQEHFRLPKAQCTHEKDPYSHKRTQHRNLGRWYCNMLQCVVVCGSVVQCVSVCCMRALHRILGRWYWRPTRTHKSTACTLHALQRAQHTLWSKETLPPGG